MNIQQFREITEAAGPMQVDQEASVVRGVKILGQVSKNGRTYKETAMREAAALYEGASVNIDHPDGRPDQPRSYRDRFAIVKNVHFREGGLWGDLHYNPKHAVAEQFAWDAENAPL